MTEILVPRRISAPVSVIYSDTRNLQLFKISLNFDACRDNPFQGRQREHIFVVLRLPTHGSRQPTTLQPVDPKRREVDIQDKLHSDATNGNLAFFDSPCRVGQRCQDVLPCQIRIGAEDLFFSSTGCQEAQHGADRDAQPANARLASHDFRVERDAFLRPHADFSCESEGVACLFSGGRGKGPFVG